jgi:acyl carrier protein
MEEQLKEILCDVLGVDETELTPQALLCEDLGMDSLDRVELAMRIEEELLNGEDIDEAADGWMTVQDVVDTVTKTAKGVR